MFDIAGWFVFAFVVGAIARLILPGRGPGGVGVTILLGIAGAVVASVVGWLSGFYPPNVPAAFLMSVIASVLLLSLYRKRRPA